MKERWLSALQILQQLQLLRGFQINHVSVLLTYFLGRHYAMNWITVLIDMGLGMWVINVVPNVSQTVAFNLCWFFLAQCYFLFQLTWDIYALTNRKCSYWSGFDNLTTETQNTKPSENNIFLSVTCTCCRTFYSSLSFMWLKKYPQMLELWYRL